MRIQIIDSDNISWNSYVNSIETATNYHQFGWKNIIEKSFSHDCYYLAALNQNDTCEGILPLVHMKSKVFGNFLVSVPFVNYGGPISLNAEAMTQLLAEAENIRKACSAEYVELRFREQSLEHLPTKQHKVTMILHLEESADSQWKRFNAKLRNQIRKAEKCGLEITIGHVELLDGFYEVFARNMRDLGTPVYGKGFFKNVLDEFPDSTKIFAVKHNGLVIAAGLASWFRDTVEVPWASSINDYKAFCPNNMLYWEAIKFAVENGFKKFDFGRSTPNEGTFNFKRQWGAEPLALNWQYLLEADKVLPELNPNNPKFGIAIRIWQKLPVGLTRLLGPHIVRNIP